MLLRWTQAIRGKKYNFTYWVYRLWHHLPLAGKSASVTLTSKKKFTRFCCVRANAVVSKYVSHLPILWFKPQVEGSFGVPTRPKRRNMLEVHKTINCLLKYLLNMIKNLCNTPALFKLTISWFKNARRIRGGKLSIFSSCLNSVQFQALIWKRSLYCKRITRSFFV